jgi:hypothetical protein
MRGAAYQAAYRAQYALPVNREDILAEMRRTAAENGGKPLGIARFEQATGIRQGDWLPYWSRMGDLQREAGFAGNRLQGAYDEDYLLDRLIALARENGRLPTSRELITKGHNDPTFPAHTVYTRRWPRAAMIQAVLAYCADKPDHADIVAMVEPLAAKHPAAPRERAAADTGRYGFVYLVQAHRGEYKIGRTNLVDRRLSELGVTSAVEHELVHEIKTDDPGGVEAYWHRRFKDKHMRGEWFKLTAADVRAFRRWRRVY